MTPRSNEADNSLFNTPRLIIQCDWNVVLKEPGGQVWVTCQEIGKNGKHGSLRSQITTRDEPLTHNKIVASDGFSVAGYLGMWIKVTHKDPNCSYTFVAPHKTFNNIHEHSISSLSVSDGGLGVSASTDNKLRLWDIETGSIRRELEGHLWDVYCTKFFPSGLVVLSSGSDMQLKIWAAENGQCPVTLKGHRAAVTDLEIIERGRNVISVSKDGTARLWDCGQGTSLYVYKPNGEPIHDAFCTRLNCCSVYNVNFNLGEPEEQPSDREVLTEGKLLVVGDEIGNVKGFGLRSKQPVFEFACNSPVNCCAFLNNEEIICGTEDGNLLLLQLYEFENSILCKVSSQWMDSKSAVMKLYKCGDGFFASRGDGSSTYYSKESDCRIELTGPDCDPVYSVTGNSKQIFTACRDSSIRVYNIESIPF